MFSIEVFIKHKQNRQFVSFSGNEGKQRQSLKGPVLYLGSLEITSTVPLRESHWTIFIFVGVVGQEPVLFDCSIMENIK